jgi:hypothetical protein
MSNRPKSITMEAQFLLTRILVRMPQPGTTAQELVLMLSQKKEQIDLREHFDTFAEADSFAHEVEKFEEFILAVNLFLGDVVPLAFEMKWKRFHKFVSTDKFHTIFG